MPSSGSFSAIGFLARRPASIVPASDEVPWTPDMILRGVSNGYWGSATRPSSIRQVGGAPCAASDPVEFWDDGSPFGNHAASAATNGGSSSNLTRPIYGPPGSAVNGILPVRFNSGLLTNRLNTASTFNGPMIIFMFGFWRPPASGDRAALGCQQGANSTFLSISDSSVPGRVYVGDTIGSGVIETDTNNRFAMYEVSGPNSSFLGRKNDSETQSGVGAGFFVTVGRALSIGNDFNPGASGRGADFDLCEILAIQTSALSRANANRWWGWVARTYGAAASALLPADHPYKIITPTVPAAAWSTFDWTDVLTQTSLDVTRYLGFAHVVASDSWVQGEGIPAQGNDTTNLWGIPYSLTQAALDQLRASIYPGGGVGSRIAQWSPGFLPRGYRHINATSGLADRTGERISTPGANGRSEFGSYRYMMALVSNVAQMSDKNSGGGLAYECNSLPPHFKTTRRHAYGRPSWGWINRTVTISIANPAVISDAGHAFKNDTEIVFFSTGNLPAALSGGDIGATFFVKNAVAGVSYQVSTSVGGAAVSTLGNSQNGTHTVGAGALTSQFRDLGQSAAFTMATGTPGVLTVSGMTLSNDQKVVMRTTGKLLDGVLMNRVYYVRNWNLGAGTFEVSLTSGGASIDLSGSQSGTHTIGIDEQVTFAEQVVAFVDCQLDDMEYAHQNVAPIKFYTPVSEGANPATNGYYGTMHPMDDQAQFDVWFEMIPRLRASSIIADLTAYGGAPGQNLVRIHNDAMYGASTGAGSVLIKAITVLLSTGRTVLQEIDYASEHNLGDVGIRDVASGSATDLTIPDMNGSGADIVRTGWWPTDAFNSGPIITDEMWQVNPVGGDGTYPGVGGFAGRQWIFTNGAMVVMKTANYSKGPWITAPFHLGKLGRDPSNEGYGVLTFDEVAGTIVAFDAWNDGYRRALADHLEWGNGGSIIKAFVTPSDSVINFWALYWTKPSGRMCVALVNRLNSTFAPPGRFTGLGGGSRLLRGTRFTLLGPNYATVLEEDLGFLSRSAIPINLRPWSLERYVEQ